MQRKNWTLLGIIAVFLTASLFLLRSSSATGSEKPGKVEKATCCKKTNPDCVEKGKSTGEMLPESLSRQFIFILSPVY
jgi:hypothetical protein